MKTDPLRPELGLLVKIGSVVVHVEEMLSSKGHAVDRDALGTLLEDKEVKQWIKDMGVFLPLKR